MRRKLLLSVAVSAAMVMAIALPAGASAGHNSAITNHPALTGAEALHASAGVRPDTPAWTAYSSTMPTPVAEVGGSTVVGSNLIIAGGYTDTSDVGQLTQIEAMNVNTGVWTLGATFPSTPSGLADAGVCSNPATGLVYIINGASGGFLVDALQIYNPATNTFTTGTAPPFISQDTGCGFIGGTLYAFGGWDAGNLNTTYSYNTSTGVWTTLSQNMVVGAFWNAYTSVPGHIISAGGEDYSTGLPLNSVQVYSPTGGWHALANLPQGIRSPGIAFLSKKVLVFGGDNSGVANTNTYVCSGHCTSWSNSGVAMGNSGNLGVMFSAYGATSSRAISAGGYTTGFAAIASGAQHLP